MDGGGSHWADMKPATEVPGMTYRNNGQNLTELPPDFYSTKNYTDSLIHFIDHNKKDGKPFFAYLSFTATHDPLHAPKEYIDKYKGHYDIGWDSLRLERLEALKQIGLINADLIELPFSAMVPKWESLSVEMKEEYARDMEVYAAMVDYLDMSVGRIIQYLKENNLYDNTLIVFFSDNGANGAPASAYPGNGDGKYLATFNNKLENRGLPNSYIEMGPGWAQAVSSPFRLYKSFTSEGGIKSPMIIKSPGSTNKRGEWNHSFIHVSDILPTFLNITGASYPSEIDSKSINPPIGKSILPILLGESTSVHENDGMGYELFEMKAFIKGDWKILRLPVPFGNNDWELFNLKDDPGELHDLSRQNPEKKTELVEAWREYALQNNVYDHKGYFDALYRKIYSVE